MFLKDALAFMGGIILCCFSVVNSIFHFAVLRSGNVFV